MHQRLLNQARLGVLIRPRGPILIKSGIETPDPTRPGMEFVRTRHAERGETVYLPGTSLKGAIRAHAERALAGLGVKVCNPLDKKEACHSKHRDEKVSSSAIFARQCTACRTFGSLHLAGRVHVLDAYPWSPDPSFEEVEDFAEANQTETRWQVGIDRKTGQAKGGALFDLEVVVKGGFYAEIHLRNFQLWQLGLIAAVLIEMSEGHAAIGFGKSRGLGQVSIHPKTLFFSSADSRLDALRGTAELCPDGKVAPEVASYGLFAAGDLLSLEGLIPSQEAASELRLEKTWRGAEVVARGRVLEILLDRLIEEPLASFVSAKGRRITARNTP